MRCLIADWSQEWRQRGRRSPAVKFPTVSTAHRFSKLMTIQRRTAPVAWLLHCSHSCSLGYTLRIKAEASKTWGSPPACCARTLKPMVSAQNYITLRVPQTLWLYLPYVAMVGIVANESSRLHRTYAVTDRSEHHRCTVHARTPAKTSLGRSGQTTSRCLAQLCLIMPGRYD